MQPFGQKRFITEEKNIKYLIVITVVKIFQDLKTTYLSIQVGSSFDLVLRSAILL